MIAVAVLVFVGRSRYAGFSCLRFDGVVAERVVRLRGLRLGKNATELERKVLTKINNEIKLFNNMHIVMPCRNGVAVHFINALANLVKNVRWIPKTADGFAKLLYLYASANLMLRSGDALARRQLLKNCLFVFGKTVIKKSAELRPAYINLYAHRQAKYKFLACKILDAQDFEIVGEQLRRRDSVSYTTFLGKDVTVKHYADKHLPICCYNIKTVCDIRFAYRVGADKMKYNLSHTSDTFVCVGDGRAVGVYVDGRANFGSSICEKTDDMKIYAELDRDTRIFIVNAKTKAEVMQLVGGLKARNGRLDYLCTDAESHDVRVLENLYTTASDSRFVVGDCIREKLTLATKHIPTLFLPTLVYTIEEQQDFFRVVDAFGYFRRIAKAGRNINIVFLYSSLNDNVREIMSAFADKIEARELIDLGIFLFFVDRVTVDSKVVNYLSLMVEERKKTKYSWLANKDSDCFTNNIKVSVARHTGNSFPITHSIFVHNTANKNQGAKVFIPIDVSSGGYASVVSKAGAGLVVTCLKPSARSCNYKLPTGAVVVSGSGIVIDKVEVVAERIYIVADVKLNAHEEKVLKVIKNDGGLRRAERKQSFIGSIENLKINAGDSRFVTLFGCNIDDTNTLDKRTGEMLSNIKSAVRNYDRELFYTLTGRHNTITSEFWAFLVSSVLGIKLVRGKVQLTPCIQITGDFELGFTYHGIPYNFTVKQRGSGFTINYGEQEYKNFVQVAVK